MTPLLQTLVRVLILFAVSCNVFASNYSLSNVQDIPKTIANDTSYTVNFNYSTPDNIDAIDIQLAIKTPDGRLTYGVTRQTFPAAINGSAYFTHFKTNNKPAVGSNYIWEIKLLPVEQESEENPLLYHTSPLTIKQSGFIIHEFNAPNLIHPYDTYDLSISYTVDQSVLGHIALETADGEEILRIDSVNFFDTHDKNTKSYNTRILNNPAPGNYFWKLTLQAQGDESQYYTVVEKTLPTTVALEDQLKDITIASTAVAPGMTREIAVTYNSTQERDILVEFWSNHAPHYRVVRQSVAKGSGSITVPVTIPDDISDDNQYYWWVKLVPKGGQWWQMFNELGSDAVLATNPTQKHFFTYPVYYFDNKTFSSTKRNTNYLSKVGGDIVDGEAGIYLKSSYNGNHTEYFFSLKSGDIGVIKRYSNAYDTVTAAKNPYHDASQFRSYRSLINAFAYSFKQATESLPELQDANLYVTAVDNELNGVEPDIVERDKLHFGYLFRHYPQPFLWSNGSNHPNTIVLNTSGIQVSNVHYQGLSIKALSLYGLEQHYIQFNFETGAIHHEYINGTGDDDFNKSFLPPYKPSGSDPLEYTEQLRIISDYLDKLSKGTQFGDTYIALPYPQMLEYKQYIDDLRQQLTPINLDSTTLYYAGFVQAFDYDFISRGPSNHATVWEALFSKNNNDEWLIRTAELPGTGVGELLVQFNFKTGELFVYDSRSDNNVIDYVMKPPANDDEIKRYTAGLQLLIDNLHVVETQHVHYSLTRAKPQLFSARAYFQSIIEHLGR